MKRAGVLVCGVVAYATFLGTFLYLMAFSPASGPKRIDSGEPDR